MQFSTKIDGFEQKDSQGFENSYNSYEQYPLEKFFIFTIYQNYTLALIVVHNLLKDIWKLLVALFKASNACALMVYIHNMFMFLYRKGTSIRQAPVFRHLGALRRSPWKFIIWMNEL